MHARIPARSRHSRQGRVLVYFLAGFGAVMVLMIVVAGVMVMTHASPIAAAFTSGQAAEETSHSTMPAAGIDRITVRVESGDIRLIADGKDDVIFTATRRVEDDTREKAAAALKLARVQVDRSGSTIAIRDVVPPEWNRGTHGPRNANLRLDLHVPAGLSVKWDTGAGNCEVTGRFAEMSAHTGAGNVQASGLSCAGAMSVRSGAGNVEIDRAACSGSEARVESGAGNVRLSLTGLPAGTVTVSTSAGNAEVGLPASARASIRMRTSAGNADSDFAEVTAPHPDAIVSSERQGDLNGGGPRVEITTSAGNVSLRRTR